MDRPVRVVLDAMGGDHAPGALVQGAVLAAEAFGCEIQLVGPEGLVRAELERTRGASRVQDLLSVVDAPEVVEMKEHGAAAIRLKRRSSIVVGLERVRQGAGDCFVSAGNTGAVLAGALLALRRIDGITSDRPALAAFIPTVDGSCVLVDAGANVDCRPEWLAQFAVMGSVYAELALGKEAPGVATLSIGEEEGKGNALLAEAVPLIRAQRLRYLGHVEGKDVPLGAADVVVADGFTGNVFLKGAEGVVEAMTRILRRELIATPFRRLLAAGLRPAFRAVRHKLSYEEYGGAPLLGVNGVCIVAHGRSTPYAIRNAIRLATSCVERDLVAHIAGQMADVHVAVPAGRSS